MKEFFVESYLDTNQVHWVHDAQCTLLTTKVEYLGVFVDIRTAVLLARTRGFDSYPCHICLHNEHGNHKSWISKLI